MLKQSMRSKTPATSQTMRLSLRVRVTLANTRRISSSTLEMNGGSVMGMGRRDNIVKAIQARWGKTTRGVFTASMEKFRVTHLLLIDCSSNYRINLVVDVQDEASSRMPPSKGILG